MFAKDVGASVSFGVQEALGFYCRHATGGGGGNRLTVYPVLYVAGVEDAWNARPRAAVGDNVAVRVKLELPLPKDLRGSLSVPLASGALEGDFLNTGVPHFVIPVEDLEGVEVETLGRQIRFHPMFAPAGPNVDFIRQNGRDGISIRTYERGVEQETLACGTGAVAAVLVASVRWGLPSPVPVVTRGGEILKVHFRGDAAGGIEELFLEGETLWVYDGELAPEAFL